MRCCRKIVTQVGSLSLFVVLVGGCDAVSHVESSETSSTMPSKLSPSSDHPLTGFWRSDCADAFGLAVQPAGPAEYSVSFCGPGGCFEPGTYRPNSRIVDDPEYRITDANTIDVRGRDGFTTYYRCAKDGA